MKKQNRQEVIMGFVTWAAAVVTIATLLFIIVFILVRGVLTLTPRCFRLLITAKMYRCCRL